VEDGNVSAVLATGEYIAQEASAIRRSVLLADTLPEDTRTAVRTALKQYLRYSSCLTIENNTISTPMLRYARSNIPNKPSEVGATPRRMAGGVAVGRRAILVVPRRA
jgi:hypothetical protein